MSSSSNESLFSSALGPESGTLYRMSRAIAEAFPERRVVEGLTHTFDIEEFSQAGRCEARPRSNPHPLMQAEWRRRKGISATAACAVFDVTWNGRSLVVVKAEWFDTFCHRTYVWVVAESRTVARELASEVCEFCNEPRNAVLLFQGGCWSKSPEMWEQIEAASFEDLVLSGDRAREIREDFASFLRARKDYERYGVPWKRGVLFVGPPGNGKTHCLRATIKFLGVPCLYVHSLKSRYETDDANIAKVFERAREVTPCCLVFEDLDAIITSENRSVFLNQLDGFANSAGLLTLATTNHPERLDPAILERPSRFDRKYHFGLPNDVERRRYAASWIDRLDAAMRIEDADRDRIIEATDGFSFAYLKELFLSSMVRWMKKREPGSMTGILDGQLATLREQMKTDTSDTPKT